MNDLSDNDPTLHLLAGTRLNGIYEIDAYIAGGGFSEVYKAHNIEKGDHVAIKMILTKFSSHKDISAMFRREADILGSLSHDAIVRYFIFTKDPTLGRSYLAMEFVDGCSLEQRIESGPMDTASVGCMLKRVAGALTVAHDVGVFHRDISPDNIILPDNDPRRAKIVDFGIAKQTASDATIIGGGFAGKYGYVSPEQLGLAGGEVGPKSDVYSLGLVIGEALLGRSLGMAGSPVEVVEKRRRLPNLNGIDPAWRKLIEGTLQPNPTDRPTMTEVAGWEPSVRDSTPRPWTSRAPERVVATPEVKPVSLDRARRSIGAIIMTRLLVVLALVGAAGGAWYVVKAGADTNEPPFPLMAEMALQATSGTDIRVDLPAFVDEEPQALTLAFDGIPPGGIELEDRGGGLGVLRGAPVAPGTFSFGVVATDGAGLTSRIDVSLTVATPPPFVPITHPAPANPSPLPVPAPAPQAQGAAPTTRQLVAAYNAEPCQYASVEGSRLVAFGKDDRDFITLRESLAGLGATSSSFARVEPGQCAALQFAASINQTGTLPILRDVTPIALPGFPFTGEILNVDQRQIAALIVFSDGKLICIPDQYLIDVDGGKRILSALSYDATYSGTSLLLLAVASDSEFPSLASCRESGQHDAPTLAFARILAEVANGNDANLQIAAFRAQ